MQTQLSEGEVLSALNNYVASATTRANILVDPYRAGHGEPVDSVSGISLCLYYAALDAPTYIPSVHLPSSGGIKRQLHDHNCPPRFLTLFNRWAQTFPHIRNLPREHQVHLEWVLCNSTHYSDISSVSNIAFNLRELASDISQCQSYRSQYNGTNIMLSPIPDYTTPRHSAPVTPLEAHYPTYYPYSPGPPPPMSTGMPTYSHPSAPNTPASAPCYLPEATRPNIIAHDSGGEPGGFVGGFVQRGSTLPSPVSAPGPSTQYPDEPELAAARPARYSTIGPGYQSTRDLDDPTSTTDKIANVISSSMPISDIIKILCLHGCRNLSQELDVRSCDEAPRSSGGCSVVYFGRLYNGTPVALKTVFRSGSNEEERRHLKRAARELYTWSRCDHPNVAKLLGLAEFRGQIAMVSRWMEKGDLCKHLKSNPDADRLSLCIQIASALAHLHDSIGVVHGDLKGPNVLISNHGTATLIDFGNAVLGDSDLQFTATVKDSAWTTRWAAPELFEGSKHSTETDVYALGMTILETVTGKTPYADKTDLQATRAIIQKEIPARPYADIPDTEQGNRLWGLLLECWHKDPTKRPGAGRVCERLKTFLYGGISFRPLYEEPGTY